MKGNISAFCGIDIPIHGNSFLIVKLNINSVTWNLKQNFSNLLKQCLISGTFCFVSSVTCLGIVNFNRKFTEL